MPPSDDSVLTAIMAHYEHLAETPGYEWVRWSDRRRRFSESDANAFLVGLVLDQGQDADRAWDKAQHIVETHFQDDDNWWQAILDTHHSTVRSICRKGYHGKSYGERFQAPKFPGWLRGMARVVVDEYEGDARKVWNNADASSLYWRLRGMPGIGDALAKMGQFILVRNYGVAGGAKNRSCLAAKPDEHVRRVSYRAGLSTSSRTMTVVRALEALQLPSPADFDAAVWDIGRRWCSPSNPSCGSCPLTSSCPKNGLS